MIVELMNCELPLLLLGVLGSCACKGAAGGKAEAIPSGARAMLECEMTSVR